MNYSYEPEQELPTKPPCNLIIQSIAVRVLLIAFASLVALAVSSLSMGQTRPRTSSAGTSMVYEGFTEPKHDILVAATEIGRLDEITVEVGEAVRAGQEIGKLEDALQSSSVRIAKHQATMTGELEAAKAEADLHRSRTETLRALAAEGMARPDELVRAETDLRVATSRHIAAEEQLTLRKLELERYRLQLERRKIRVPMDGVISQLLHKPGEYITPGDPAVVRLLVMDQMFAVFNIPVEDVRLIKVGSPARVYLRSTSTTIDSTISLIAPDIDGESGTVQVRVELDNSKRQLLAGDRCTLHLMPGKPPIREQASRATLPSARMLKR